MLGQHDFVVVEDADSDIFPDYEATHGLPKFIRRSSASTEKQTNLLTAKRVETIDFAAPKHPNLKASSSLEWDAYLLWRLSERYGESGFPIGKIDKDRVIRLYQLGVLDVVDPTERSHADEETAIRISAPRRSLDEHFKALQQSAGAHAAS